jgi:phosphoenolpyruvate carboxylase
MSGVAELQDLLSVMAGDAQSALTKHLAEIKSGLDTFMECFGLGLRSLTESDRSPRKQSAIRQIDQALDRAIGDSPDPDILQLLLVFRAEWYALGLGLSHIHFRLNAVQLHNAIRSEIALDHAPDRSASRRHYLGEITRLLDEVEPVNIHYGTLAAEQTTAKRLLMLAAQFEKHFDGRTPIRLLVAESDTPFTLLTALYYARLFGVDEHVEISPLFETAAGLQRGDRVIAELLDNVHFLAYIRRQGRFAVQLGFSDSGRYIGQVAANLAIERFKLRLVGLWERCGLSDIQLLFFDTHGESMGRGAHPGSLEHRFLTTHTPRVRSALSEMSAPHKHEVSFQGGDGYRWFASESTALATLTDFLKVRLERECEETGDEDRFYTESDWALDFFLTVREYQDHLAHHPGYLALLDSFAPNLLYPTGSRATKRQGALSSAGRLSAVNQIRAIPHNAMLQQLGFLANVLGGVGTAIDRAPGRFEECLEDSPRLQLLMKLIERAEAVSSIDTLIGYAELLDPGWWLDHADSLPAGSERTASRRLSKLLESAFDTASINAFLWKVRRDYALLQDYLGKSTPIIEDLHAERVGQIRRIYLKAASVPRFSTRMDVSPDQLVIRLLRLDVPEVVARLREIFPAEVATSNNDRFGEVATYTANAGGYARQHEEIFDEIEAAYQRVLEISGMIALRVGSFG